MRKMTMLMVVTLAIPVSACEPESSPAADLAMEEQEIRARSTESLGAAQAGDHTGYASKFAADGELLEPNGPTHTGRAAIAAFSERIGALPNLELTWGPTQITVAESADLAVERGTYELSFDGPDGRVEDNGKYVTVWVKNDDEWLVKHDIFNSSVPIPGT